MTQYKGRRIAHGRRVPHYAAGGLTVSAPDSPNYNMTGVPAAADVPGVSGFQPTAQPTTPSTAPPVVAPTTATAQGLPQPTGALGYTPGAETNAAGSWGGASSGIPAVTGDTSMSPQGSPNAWTGDGGGGDYVPPPPPMPAAAPDTPTPAAATTPIPTSAAPQWINGMPFYVRSGGAIPAYDDGGSVDPGALTGSPDQGQQGQAGDPMAAVRSAMTATRAAFGLTDAPFDLMSQQLAGNIPTKPAGPGGDQTRGGPQDRGNQGQVSENDSDTESMGTKPTGGGSQGRVSQGGTDNG